MADPWQWADPTGAVQFYAVLAAILIGCAVKLFAHSWDDWLDERSGRGSIRDWWLLREIERDAQKRSKPPV
jgi:hypothetical protein